MAKYGVPSAFIDLVRDKNNIVDIASKYMTLTKRGSNYWACCPFHTEKTPSFSIKPDGQFFKCFGCGESGNVIGLVMKLENVDFLTSVEILAKNAGLEMPSEKDSELLQRQKRERDRMYQIYHLTTDFYHDNLKKYPNSAQVNYLKSRQISDEMIEKFKIGASISYDDLPRYLLKQGFKADELYTAGVIGKNEHGMYDFFGNRLIFPIFNGFGDTVAFSGRSVEASPEHTKYKNTPQTPIFNKSEILFGYNFLRELKREHMLDTVIIVEGHIDVIACHQYGFTNTIGCMGTALTTLHAKRIKQLADNVILCLDADSAGANATYKAIDTLNESGLNVKVLRLDRSKAKDPDEFLKKYGKDEFMAQLTSAMDCVDFVLTDSLKKYDLNSNADKSNYVNEALNYISKFSTPAEREIYLVELQKIVKIPIDILRNSMLTQTVESKMLEATEPAENVSNKYIQDCKIMVLASILYKKDINIEEVSGLFASDDELSDLYRFFKEKIDNHQDFNASILFDNFDIKKDSLIDKVINYSFSPDEIHKREMADVIANIKRYNSKHERAQLHQALLNATTDEDRMKYLKALNEFDQNNKENK